MPRYKDADDFDIATRPHFAGVGDYVKVVSDDAWVAAAVKMIDERGAEAVLRAMLSNLREDFPPLDESDEDVDEELADADAALTDALLEDDGGRLCEECADDLPKAKN